MKFFVTGASGQLGSDVMSELNRRGHEAIGPGFSSACKGADLDTESCLASANKGAALDIGAAPASADKGVVLDITDRDAVNRAICKSMPDAVIHCAAWTAVDAAEDEDKQAAVYSVNVEGTRNVADACRKVGARMLYVSTDYVFDGKGNKPRHPDCRDYNPLNVYGRTKLEGELAVANTLDRFFIVRTAWVFGAKGTNFVKTMINAGRTHDEVRVVNDQIGTPTYTYDLARLLVDMCETEKYGYYHATNEGEYVSWYEFCVEIYRQCGLGTKVVPVTTEEYGLSKASRPSNSRLDGKKLAENGFRPLPDWRDALRRFLSQNQ